MNIRLKVCGMRDNVGEIASLEPDYLGFIFYERSSRYSSGSITSPITRGIKRVGVFVNEDFSRIQDLIRSHQLDFVQLHGDETVEFCGKLREKGVGVIKVFRIEEGFDFSITGKFADVADFYLFDTHTPMYGGSGKRFNWEMLTQYDQHKAFFLSGGLDEDSLEELSQLAGMNLHALDFNSGVEVSPGLKDVEKVKRIIKKLNVLNHEVFGR